MSKKDVIISLVIGGIVAWLLWPVWLNTGFVSAYWSWRWLLLVVVPILSVAGLAIMYFVGKKFLVVWQAAKFILVGILNTFIDLGVLNILILISGISVGLGYSVFKGISFIVAVTNSYFWNKLWVFGGSKKIAGREFLQFFIVSVIGFSVNVGVASLVVNLIGPQFGLTEKIWANIGAILATLVTMTWNFSGYKFLVFKK